MQGIRINRNLLKVVIKSSGDIEAYRLYVIARHFFARRSGLFSLDELCDVLHSYFGYKSLHRRPGNKRRQFKENLSERFYSSFLFREAPDGRFLMVSERKILYRFKGTSKSSWYMLPDLSILQSKKLFYDFCIGSLLSGNKFRANKNIAKYCGCTVRRIQFATSRNNSGCIFLKQYNFIEDVSGSYEEVTRLRAQLFNVHGISSPLPVRYKNEWVLRLNAPNSYKSFVLSGVKGFKAQPPESPVRKSECWFKPVPERSRQLRMFESVSKRWVFNEKVYGLDKYLCDNSELLA